MFDLTIVIPAYREARRIGVTLERLAAFLQHDAFLRDKKTEVLVVVADAPDDTLTIVNAKKSLFESGRIHFQVLRPGPRVGKGRDVQYGMLRAKGNAVVFMDADLATPLTHLQQFYEGYKQGYDVVVGTRNLLTYRSNIFHNFFAWIGNRLYQVAGGVHVEDTQCGFKLFSHQAALLCFSKLTILGWGFDVEVLAIARTNKLKIESIRIDDWEDKPYSTYKDSPLRITLRSVRDFVYIQTNKVQGKYVAKDYSSER